MAPISYAAPQPAAAQLSPRVAQGPAIVTVAPGSTHPSAPMASFAAIANPVYGQSNLAAQQQYLMQTGQLPMHSPVSSPLPPRASDGSAAPTSPNPQPRVARPQFAPLPPKSDNNLSRSSPDVNLKEKEEAAPLPRKSTNSDATATPTSRKSFSEARSLREEEDVKRSPRAKSNETAEMVPSTPELKKTSSRCLKEDIVCKQRLANERFIIKTLNDKEPQRLWEKLVYFAGTPAELKEEARKTGKPIYFSTWVDGPVSGSTCLGSRLWRCTALSDPNVLERLSKEFIPYGFNLTENKGFPVDVFPCLKDHQFWFKKLKPKSSIMFDSENFIFVDSSGGTCLLNYTSSVQPDYEYGFSISTYIKVMDKALKKRDLLQAAKSNFNQGKLIQSFGNVINVAKSDLGRKKGDATRFLAFKRQMDVVPFTEALYWRLVNNGLLKGNPEQPLPFDISGKKK